MLLWSAILFVLGITAFLDALFNYGEIFRQVNSVLFLLISLAILVRTTTKKKLAKMEQYAQKVEDLEQRITNLTRPKDTSVFK
jgi:hypothetical protein